MKKLFSLFTALLAIVSFGFAQYNYNAIPIMDYFRVEQMTEESLSKVLSENDIQGSPYLNDDFCEGTIYTTSKQKILDVPIRYNIYNDDLEFKTPKGRILAIDKPEDIELAEFCDYKMVYSSYLNRKNENSAFFKIIEKGDLSLYAKPDIVFQKEQPGDGIRADKPAKFIEKQDILFLKTKNNPAIEINNKKDIISAIPDHKKEIADFIKKKKIKPGELSDIKELVRYYNSL